MFELKGGSKRYGTVDLFNSLYFTVKKGSTSKPDSAEGPTNFCESVGRVRFIRRKNRPKNTILSVGV